MNPTAAVIQMNTGDDVAANLAQATGLLEQAAAQGAVLAALPENFAFMGAHEADKLAHAEPDGQGPIQDWLSATAQRLGLWILAGTVPIAAPANEEGRGRVYAASLVVNAQGQRAARYDKIHLFDVDVPGTSGERYWESNSIAPGSLNPVVVDTPVGKLGLSVCYDLRFPELFRSLITQGATAMSIPAAFTAKTGAAHWHTLLKARAVENQCFVIAAGQCGQHPGGRSTYGHSLILDPWGETLAAVQGDEPGIAVAVLDAKRLQQIRSSFPALSHRRF
jgi:nitrilase